MKTRSRSYPSREWYYSKPIVEWKTLKGLHLCNWIITRFRFNLEGRIAILLLKCQTMFITEGSWKGRWIKSISKNSRICLKSMEWCTYQIRDAYIARENSWRNEAGAIAVLEQYSSGNQSNICLWSGFYYRFLWWWRDLLMHITWPASDASSHQRCTYYSLTSANSEAIITRVSHLDGQGS